MEQLKRGRLHIEEYLMFDIIPTKLWLIASNPLDLWSFEITQPYILLPATRKIHSAEFPAERKE